MRKHTAIMVLIMILLLVLPACGRIENQPADDGRFTVVATIFPEYDWAKEILGERLADESAELTLLVDNGSDVHSYQPTVDDIMKIASCDVFIYVGGESDAWVDDVLEKVAGDNVRVIRLLDLIGDHAKEEELVEGMQDAADHDHAADADADHDDAADHDTAADHDDASTDHDTAADHDDDTPELDEHIWLSLKNAKLIAERMAEVFAEEDALNAETYRRNAENYIAKLDALDAEYEETVNKATRDTLLFGDRFPFRYLADDYGLEYYAAFSGCSAETEASFETVAFLANKADALGLDNVMVIDGSDEEIANAIINNTASHDQRILALDSLQSINKEAIENGATYLGIMEQNRTVLDQALN